MFSYIEFPRVSGRSEWQRSPIHLDRRRHHKSFWRKLPPSLRRTGNRPSTAQTPASHPNLELPGSTWPLLFFFVLLLRLLSRFLEGVLVNFSGGVGASCTASSFFFLLLAQGRLAVFFSSFFFRQVSVLPRGTHHLLLKTTDNEQSLSRVFIWISNM